MSTGRIIVRAAVSAVASLALVTGTGAATAFAVETTTESSAERCAAEKRDVGPAKKKFKKAKKAKNKAVKKYKKAKKTRTKADDKKAAKVKKKAVKKFKKTRRNLERQRAEASSWCARAHNEEQAGLRTSELILIYSQMVNNPAVEALPDEAETPLRDAIAAALAHLGGLEGQIAGAEPAALAQIVTNLHALDPSTLDSPLADLQAKMAEIDGGQSGAVEMLLTGLLSDLPGADTGDLDKVRAAFQALAAELQAFDVQASGDGQMQDIAAKMRAAQAALTKHEASLKALLELLRTLAGGQLPSDQAGFIAILQPVLGVLPTEQPEDGELDGVVDTIVDGLSPVTDPVTGGTEVTDVTEDLIDVIEEIFTGGIPDPLDPITNPVTDVVDGVTDPLEPVTDPVTDVVDGVVGGVTDGVTDPLTDPTDGLTGGTETVTDPVTDVVDGVTDPVTDVVDDVVDGGTDLVCTALPFAPCP